MKNLIVYPFVLTVFILLFSCRKDFSTIPSTSSNLIFSTDTVFLDTVFSNISTSTYTLKVYNNSSDDIHIPSISLLRANSFYRLNVDGLPGTRFKNVPLRAKDSLFIFIEGTINYSSTDPLYVDAIIFDSGDKSENVDLITLVQDAHFIYVNNQTDLKSVKPYFKPESDSLKIHYLTNAEILFCNDTSDEKSIVFYGYCGVEANKTLTIAANKRLYFHKNSALVIEKDARLIVNGTLDEKVLIEGDRLEPAFSETPGQWDAIWLRAGSKSNEINYLNSRNSTFGIICDSVSSDNSTPTLTLKNTELYNNSEVGLLANQSHIIAENVVIGNSRTASFKVINGGTYDFNHSTLANYWSESIRRGNTIQISNINSNEELESQVLNLTANFTNTIIDGNNSKEIYFEKNKNDTFDFLFQNCLIKYDGTSEDPLYDFTDTDNYLDIEENTTADYLDTSLNKFEIGADSELIDKADDTNAARTPIDIIGEDRTLAPDIGAYQNIIFPEEEAKE